MAGSACLPNDEVPGSVTARNVKPMQADVNNPRSARGARRIRLAEKHAPSMSTTFASLPITGILAWLALLRRQASATGKVCMKKAGCSRLHPKRRLSDEARQSSKLGRGCGVVFLPGAAACGPTAGRRSRA
jgi:hypothetical protein